MEWLVRWCERILLEIIEEDNRSEAKKKWNDEKSRIKIKQSKNNKSEEKCIGAKQEKEIPSPNKSQRSLEDAIGTVGLGNRKQQ